eukprot:m.299151 g.299151  ORF g.299151 m.299151 type:complete len:311 (+) comp14049_c0_seq1:143-1075(+)
MATPTDDNHDWLPSLGQQVPVDERRPFSPSHWPAFAVAPLEHNSFHPATPLCLSDMSRTAAAGFGAAGTLPPFSNGEPALSMPAASAAVLNAAMPLSITTPTSPLSSLGAAALARDGPLLEDETSFILFLALSLGLVPEDIAPQGFTLAQELRLSWQEMTSSAFARVERLWQRQQAVAIPHVRGFVFLQGQIPVDWLHDKHNENIIFLIDKAKYDAFLAPLRPSRGGNTCYDGDSWKPCKKAKNCPHEWKRPKSVTLKGPRTRAGDDLPQMSKKRFYIDEVTSPQLPSLIFVYLKIKSAHSYDVWIQALL